MNRKNFSKSMLGDLNKDGKMSPYEKARQKAISKAMSKTKRSIGPAGASTVSKDGKRMKPQTQIKKPKKKVGKSGPATKGKRKKAKNKA